jgi:4,5-DOPA dioxygenase extradiol
MHMWPDATIPVVPVMLPALASPTELFKMGQALQPFTAEQVLVIGSGSLTHNLRRVFQGRMPAIDAPEASDCAEFRAWVAQQTAAQNWPALLDWQSQAPHAQAMHPTDEHWRPFYFAAGAAGEHPAARRIHADIEFGCLAMDAYAFGPSAAALQASLGFTEA